MPQLFLRKYIVASTPAPLDERDVKWGVKDLLKFVGVFVAALIALILVGPRLDISPSGRELMYFLLAQHVAAVLALLWFNSRGLWSGLEYFGLKWRHFRMYFLTGVVWGLICRFVPSLVVLLITQVSPSSWQSNNPLRGLELTGVAFVPLVLDIVVIGPLVEEIFFRGLLYGLLRKKLGVWKAVFISSALFGVAHGFGPIGLVTALAGVGLALVYENTGSLAPAVIAHMFGNLLAVFLVLLN
jgi:membrane protease YdiL (CAAX protease family)